jgi:hypothetical protein
MANWARQSIALATFAFINLVLFLALSSPFNLIMDTIDDQADNPESDVADDVTPIITSLRTVFGLIFVLSLIGLIVWFILGSHEEEFEEK